MRVIVPTPIEDCVAEKALKMEGVEFELALCHHPNDYAKLLYELWKVPESLVIVEWDIAPWPGAIYELQQCFQDLCAFPYHRWVTTSEKDFDFSLGCTRFSRTFIERNILPADFPETHWRDLDTKLWQLFDREIVCVHMPGVAHVRA